MKKVLALLLALTLLLTCLAGCSKEEPAPTFTVGFDAEFPPFGYRAEDGTYTGFDLEMAAECAKRMGMEVIYQPIDWDSKDLELSSGSIDCIWNGFTMNDREDDYAWTDAYMDNSQIFIVKKSDGINSFADLAGKTVMVQTDSSAQAALEEEEYADLLASFGEFRTCANYNDAFMNLEIGAVDAIAMDIGVARFQMEGRSDEFVILDPVITAEQYGVGFYIDNTALRDQVQQTLKEMVKDGTFKAISEKWFGYDVCTL